MTISGTVQALIAAFSFGIVVNAASAGLLVNISGHGSTIFKDGQRLALLIFLASAALWASIAFVSTALDTTATSSCQATVIVSTLFDQVARSSVEQALSWAVSKGEKPSPLGIISQVLIAARFIMGMVFVGITRPQFNPTCVPLSETTAIAIVVIALDAVILAALAIRAFSCESPKNSDESGGSKAVLLTITGLAIWMGTSVTLLLGFSNIMLILRTTLPAAGLFILVALVTVFNGSLVVEKQRPPRVPESPLHRPMNGNRDLASADSGYPPSRYEDIKRMDTANATAFEVTTQLGVGGQPVKGRLFPPMRPTANDDPKFVPPPQQSLGPKASIKRPKVAGKFTISNPIAVDSPDMQNALNKIPTVDLATAARNDKEKRAADSNRRSTLVAPRPAPQPPMDQLSQKSESVDGEQQQLRAPPRPPLPLSRSNTAPAPGMDSPTWSKAPGDLSRSNTMKTTKTANTGGELSVGGNASSTSSQLSPGSDALRRRSPRQLMPSSKTPAKTPTNFQPIVPGQPVRIPIPRAPPAPEQPALSPEPVKTPLQRRPTNGLPSNPRSQANKTIEGDRQTVMFINNITYDDPNTVNDIIKGAVKMPAKTPSPEPAEAPTETTTSVSAPPSPTESVKSVVHRPRPIPRKQDRPMFPADLSPKNHRRSRSGGSILNKKSVLQSQPGSPSDLPPLPPPPKSAGSEVARPQPNNTKSMTFDEKMKFMYPSSAASSPGSASGHGMKRKSSVPELPRVPSTFLRMERREVDMQEDDADDEKRRTKTTTGSDRSSIMTDELLNGLRPSNHRNTGHSQQNPADDLGNSWLPSLEDTARINQQSFDGGAKRQSSPVIPPVRFSTRTEVTKDDDAVTNWSVHSPIAPVNLQPGNARTTYVGRDRLKVNARPTIPSNISGYGDQVMTVMLDTSSEHSFGDSVDNRTSFYLEDDEKESGEATGQEKPINQWHHRVGDECPTFSTRKEQTRSRKMPPPPPLLLNGVSNRKTIVKAPTPSPLESPQAALNVIQAQLKKMEQPNRESTDSIGTKMALLDNLEMEMGEVENKWQSLQHNIDRDSMSTMTTSPAVDSRPDSVHIAAALSKDGGSARSIAASRRASRRTRLASVSRSRSRERDSSREPSSHGSETSRSQFQASLAEAQQEYIEHAPDLISKRDNVEHEILPATIFKPAGRPATQLWTATVPDQSTQAGALWTAPTKKPEDLYESNQLPGLSVRPAARKTSEPLAIQSHRLWQKPAKSLKFAVSGLWSNEKELPAPPQPERKSRPVTQRPPRRSRRVTMLPDILESPRPLSNNQDELGIFQFPWGEKSATGTIEAPPPPPPKFMAMPGTMASGGRSINAALAARALEIEASENLSFFEDYEDYEDEDDEDGDNLYDDYYDSGDEFDETTLWEIAGLLKTEDLPSKNSSLPRPHSDTLQDAVYDAYGDDEEHEESQQEQDEYEYATVAGLTLPVKTAVSEPRSSLWVANDGTEDDEAQYGLPQPDQATWEKYVPSDDDVVRAPPRTENELPTIESQDMWNGTSRRPSPPPMLWEAKEDVEEMGHGLPQPDQATWETYVPGDHDIVRAPPRTENELPTIESKDMWNGTSRRPSPPMLWEAKDDVEETGHGLPQPDQATWEAYIPDDEDVVRAPPRTVDELPVIESKVMWNGTSRRSPPPMLWEARDEIVEASHGLPQPDQATWETYIPDDEDVVRAPPRTVAELPTIESKDMWNGTSRVQAPSLLWEARGDAVEVSHGLPQPDQATWETYIPSGDDIIRAPPRIEDELPAIESYMMWMGTSQRVLSTLWEVSSEAEGTRNSYGLPQPEQSAWEKYIPAYEAPAQPRSRVEAEVPSIESTDLWMPKPERPSSTTGLLWGSSSSNVAVVAKATAEQSATGISLWEQTPAFVESETNGLFDVNAYRADYRSTSAPPAAIAMSRKPRQSKEPLAQLISRQLWKANPRTVSQESSGRSLLWSAPSSPVTASWGLFELDPERKDWRTTDAEPAALHMTTRPRKDNAPLPQLQTTRMWRANSAASEEIDWMTISSTRPRSPSIDSIASTPTTPTSDSSSVRTNTTKASTVAPSTRTGFSALRAFFSKKEDIPEVPESPASARMSRVPQVPVIPQKFVPKATKPKAALRRSHIAGAQWDVALQAAITASHVAPTLVRKKASPREWSQALEEAIAASHVAPEVRKTASPQDWDVALQEAITASHVSPKLVRKTASPRDWSRALQEAIAKSYPQTRFSRGQILPEEWEAELREAITRSEVVEQKKEAEKKENLVRNQIAQLQQALAAKSAPKSPEQEQAKQKEDLVRNQLAMLQQQISLNRKRSLKKNNKVDLDVSKRHPVFGASSLTTKATVIHPAAIGYTHDISATHPVFFGSMTTSAADVHPAALSSRGTASSSPALWSQPAAAASASSVSSMWSPSTARVPSVDDFAPIHDDMSRARPTPNFDDEVVDFANQEMWNREQAVYENERNWLEAPQY